MNDTSQHGRRATDLDPELLAAPFRVETKWHVITGATCSGKTTLINLLAANGYQTVAEIPRQHIEMELTKGRTLDEIFSSAADERSMKDWQVRVEHGLRATDVVFLDRALADYLWFWRVHKLDPNELLPECRHHRYASVFILDMLPLQLDGARIEDDAFTVHFDECLVRDYTALGYRVERVPVLSPQERLEFVLQKISEQGLT